MKVGKCRGTRRVRRTRSAARRRRHAAITRAQLACEAPPTAGFNLAKFPYLLSAHVVERVADRHEIQPRRPSRARRRTTMRLRAQRSHATFVKCGAGLNQR
jgi:hypothetical protein